MDNVSIKFYYVSVYHIFVEQYLPSTNYFHREQNKMPESNIDSSEFWKIYGTSNEFNSIIP